MAESAASDPLSSLRTTLASIKALVQNFESSIQPGKLLDRPLPPDPPNPLALLSDAAKVLRAQTTKLSLLTLNKPFTPTEITFILKSLCQECLPALMAAAQICSAGRYSGLLSRWVQVSTGSTMRALLILFDEIPQDEQGVAKIHGRGTLTSTGVIWQQCDFMTKFAEEGIVGLACQNVGDYHDLLKDAIEEVDKWRAGEVEADHIFVNHSPQDWQDMRVWHGDELGKGAHSTFNHTMEMGDPPYDGPLAYDSSVKALSDRTLKFLRLIQLLIPALIKRRIKRFPEIIWSTKHEHLPSLKQLDGLDSLVSFTQVVSEEADELAEALYLHDEKTANSRIDIGKKHAKEVLAKVYLTWDDKEDEFSTWLGKWLVKLDEI
ncbi:hypothetical protein MMC06_006194 [Schaereria dolodes]|nr:hypothetical protein [Schaereria dolodes]